MYTLIYLSNTFTMGVRNKYNYYYYYYYYCFDEDNVKRLPLNNFTYDCILTLKHKQYECNK